MHLLPCIRRTGLAAVGLLATLLAGPALADTINPSGGNAWDLYVYGNGEAIAQILTAIKLTIAPDHGGSSFRLLLLFLATAGFLVMAVKAGFDPAKNLLRMFAFIFVVWMVTYSTGVTGTGARANVHVYDRYTNYSNVVSGVPALVAVPASIVSQVGEYLTQSIEQNFSLPNNTDYSPMAISNGGPYNLFAKVISDADKFTITDPDLRRSMTAYVSDCAVTNIALGNLGVSELMNSANLMETLKKAQSNAIMTRYYPVQDPAASNSTANGGQYSAPVPAVLMKCSDAYTQLVSDVALYASALKDATASQWSSNGINTPFANAMSNSLAMSTAPGNASNYSTPESFIMQKAAVSAMTPAFRDAAARTQNNELMMATSIAQAEQSQRTSWWTAAEIFKNMMGYVFTVLQAFIFAMVPVIVICLMIPGMGGKVFINYAQILVWLTLWAPMLAIVNFLVQIFGSAELQTTLGAQGVTMNNSKIISEQANNLVIVAQFMGTLVPIMTWGLVKGAMAFTEFISHGIGSSFATQAGAQAATGNVSMGNMQLDNTSMNKFSTAMTSNVGFQEVKADHGAGSGTATTAMGGAAETVAGHNATVVRNVSSQVSWSSSDGTTHSASRSEAESLAASTSQSAQQARNIATNFQKLQSEANDVGRTLSADDKYGRDWKQGMDRAFAELANLSDSSSVSASLGADVSAGSKGAGFGGKAGADWTSRTQRAEAVENSIRQMLSEGRSHSQGTGSSESASQKTGDTTSAGTSGGIGFNDSTSQSVAESWTKAANLLDSESRSISAGISQSVSYSQTTAVSTGGGGGQLPSEAGVRARASEIAGGASAAEAAYAPAAGQVDQTISRTTNQIHQQAAKDAGGVAGLQAGAAERGVTVQGAAAPNPPLDGGAIRASITDKRGAATTEAAQARDRFSQNDGKNHQRIMENMALNFVSGRRLEYSPAGNGTGN